MEKELNNSLKLKNTTSDVKDGSISLNKDSREAAQRNQSTSVEAKRNPEDLKSLYLQGKLTAGEFARELRVYNSVVAEQYIKEAKQSGTKGVDMRSIGQASIMNPGGDLKPDEQYAKPKGQHDSNTHGDEASKQKQQEEAKKAESQDLRQRIIIANIFEDTRREVSQSHEWREHHHRNQTESDELAEDNELEKDKEGLALKKARGRGASKAKQFLSDKWLEILGIFKQGGASHG